MSSYNLVGITVTTEETIDFSRYKKAYANITTLSTAQSSQAKYVLFEVNGLKDKPFAAYGGTSSGTNQTLSCDISSLTTSTTLYMEISGTSANGTGSGYSLTRAQKYTLHKIWFEP